nr:RNB domain-containing ribonuclease [Lachnospiraceae bacterium]
ALISRLTLRSMQRAEYNTSCLGHFGLACNYYCHFTSPIRRYPDLQIHRIIKEHIHGRMSEKKAEHYNVILPMVAKESSAKERRADEAEREVEKLKKAEYMTEHLGEEYEGVISGITSWGIFVELPNTVEGMIHVSDLEGDVFYYKEDTYEMVGLNTGKTYKLGQSIKIVTDYVDMTNRTIGFMVK